MDAPRRRLGEPIVCLSGLEIGPGLAQLLVDLGRVDLGQ
jgi:hypothetical protein